jgi:hypothetical protein
LIETVLSSSMNADKVHTPRVVSSDGWLAWLPWVALFVVLVAHSTGLGKTAARLIPYGYGDMAWENAAPGMGILFMLCSALRARRAESNSAKVLLYFRAGAVGLLVLLWGAAKFGDLRLH